jgi:hypothetical protein
MLRSVVGCAVVLMVAAVGMPPAAAGPGACSYGQAGAVHEAWIPHFLHEPRTTQYPDCQFRLYLDGEEVTFTDQDWFLAGIVVYVEYEALGMSRTEAIADMDSVGHRLWFTPILPGGGFGTPEEQALSRTAYRNTDSPLERLVYNSIGVILRLSPGDYLSHYEQTYQGDVFEADVIVHVVPFS